jgi:hypothetical protein
MKFGMVVNPSDQDWLQAEPSPQVLSIDFVFGQVRGRIAGWAQNRQRPLALLPDRWADNPMQLLAG